jgi:predicted transcriptional regulator of viral defense system
MSKKAIHYAHNGSEDSPSEDALYLTAETRAGYFTTAQAAEAGYSRALLAHHAAAGNLERVDHGIYRLRRYPESPHSDLVVASLRTGDSAAVSHESALVLWDLSDILPGEVHVTVPRTASRRRPGLRLHTGRLEAGEITERDGVRVTTVERTIADVARSGLSDEIVLQAIDEALGRGLTTTSRLREYARKRGGRMRSLLERAQHPILTSQSVTSIGSHTS